MNSIEELDMDMIERVSRMFIGDDDGVVGRCLEVRAFHRFGKGIIGGYFNDAGKVAKAIEAIHGEFNVFAGLNPRKREIANEPLNELRKSPVYVAGKDTDVLGREWLLIDIDPERPANTSSSDDELKLALDVRSQIMEMLRGRGVTPIKAISGNGAHLLVRVYEPENKGAYAGLNACKSILTHLNHEFGIEGKVVIDRSVSNLSRLTRFYGSVNSKGECSNERPWRLSGIEIPETLPERVNLLDAFKVELDEALKATREARVKSMSCVPGSFLPKPLKGVVDLSWLMQYQGDFLTLDFAALFASKDMLSTDCGDGKHYVVCPWFDKHTRGRKGDSGTYILDARPEKGYKPYFKCSHDHCIDRTLEDVCEYFGADAVDAHCASKHEGKERGHTLDRAMTPNTPIVPTIVSNTYADMAVEYSAKRPRKMVYYSKSFYEWNGSFYKLLDDVGVGLSILKWLQDNPAYREKAKSMPMNEVLLNLKVVLGIEERDESAFWISGGEASGLGLLPIKNGLLDVQRAIVGEEGALIEPTDDYFCTWGLPLSYEVGAECPLWKKTLGEILPDEEDRKTLQEWFGYHLIPGHLFEAFMIFEGEGANGKSVVCNLLHRNFLGKANVSGVQLEALSPERRFPIAALKGKLANIVQEVGHVEKMAEGILKQLVSKQSIEIEKKFKDAEVITPTALLTFATNVLPRNHDRSNGIWRRLLLLKFEQEFMEDRQDRRLANETFWNESGEMPGILNWALEGLARLVMNDMFTKSERNKQSVEAYRLECNPAREFILDNYMECEGKELNSHEAYAAYAEEMKNTGRKALGIAQFTGEVKRAFPKVAQSNPKDVHPSKGDLTAGAKRTRVRFYQNLAMRCDDQHLPEMVAEDRPLVA